MMTWKDLCLDKRFEDLPFKIERNGRGQIIMSPTTNRHGYFAFRIGELMREHLPTGKVIVECGVDTEDGTKETDAAWPSAERFHKIEDEFSCSIAPEICVEVVSPSNSIAEMNHKKQLYPKAGASEVWFCDLEGNMTFHNATEKLRNSAMAPEFPLLVD